MAMDSGDEAEENQLLQDWIESRTTLQNAMFYDFLPSLMDECNQIRIDANS
ncbi:MAG: hypothetical protein SAK42_07925 [Oscillatoria sp. PMC 1076.18]|nr:hypothetical protein [Oscillatoria sp. PMC 1076.18]